MSDIKNLYPHDTVTFGRDCEVTQIPSGAKITLPKDTEGFVTQTLGGFVTLQIPAMGLLALTTTRWPARANSRMTYGSWPNGSSTRLFGGAKRCSQADIEPG